MSVQSDFSWVMGLFDWPITKNTHILSGHSQNRILCNLSLLSGYRVEFLAKIQDRVWSYWEQIGEHLRTYGAHLEHRQEPAGNTLPTWLENQNPKLFPLPRPLRWVLTVYNVLSHWLCAFRELDWNLWFVGAWWPWDHCGDGGNRSKVRRGFSASCRAFRWKVLFWEGCG